MALPATLALLLVAAMAMVAISVTIKQNVSGVNARAERAVTTPVVDAAVTKYRNALQADAIGDFNDFQIDSENQATLGVVVPSTGPVVPGVSPVFAEPASDKGRAGRWQVVHTIAPNPPDQVDLIVYLKAWSVANKDIPASVEEDVAASRPRYVRISFRPGFLSNYQLVANGTIKFVDGATIDGPIHSNGFPDPEQTSSVPEEQIWATGAVSCTSSAVITTTVHKINPSLAACNPREETGTYVNLLNTEDSFVAIQRACMRAPAKSKATCFNEPIIMRHPMFEGGSALFGGKFTADFGIYEVRLDGDRALVGVRLLDPTTSKAGPTTRIVTPTGQPSTGFDSGWTVVDLKKSKALFFADTVAVSGKATVPVTIAARKPMITTDSTGDAMAEEDGASTGAANIVIVGNTFSETEKGVVGLVSQGDVVLEQIKKYEDSGYPCITNLNAAVIAATGALTVDPRADTEAAPSNRKACPERLVFNGSVAAHRAPVMFIDWGTVKFGFPQRTYQFDETLVNNPPPFFPYSGRWDARKVVAANDDDCSLNAEFERGAAC